MTDKLTQPLLKSMMTNDDKECLEKGAIVVVKWMQRLRSVVVDHNFPDSAVIIDSRGISHNYSDILIWRDDPGFNEQISNTIWEVCDAFRRQNTDATGRFSIDNEDGGEKLEQSLNLLILYGGMIRNEKMTTRRNHNAS